MLLPLAGTFTSLHYHLVFSTKDRFPMIHADLQPRLHEYFGGIIRSEEAILCSAGGMADHVHLLARLPARLAVADLMRVLKSKSSAWIHETFPAQRKFAWQEGYGAFTVSRSDLGRVQKYIASQPRHHRLRTFQDEFLRLLAAHGIEYDERLIWK